MTTFTQAVAARKLKKEERAQAFALEEQTTLRREKAERRAELVVVLGEPEVLKRIARAVASELTDDA